MAIEAPRLVKVEGRALDGTALELPAQLPGRRTVVVIAFRQRQQHDVDRWIDLARTITVYTDPAAFRRRCGIATAEEVTVLLAGRDGVATWYRTGPPQPGDREALADALAAASPDV